MGATDASVLRKANAAMRIEVACLNLVGGCLYQSAKFLPLLLRDCCSQILNFGSMLPDKNDQCYFRNASDPRIANQLRITSIPEVALVVYFRNASDPRIANQLRIE